MDKKQAKKRIEKLKKEINYHRYLYAVRDKQEISDGALDSLKNELFKLISDCKGAITFRNKIAHKGLKDFEIEDVANHIKSIERLIEIIVNSN